jgi:hypothetical protein
MFADVKDDQLIFKNPWGKDEEQPEPLSAADFVKYVDEITMNAMPPKPA